MVRTNLIYVSSEDATTKNEADPVMAAFLSFLDRDISQAPDRVKPLSAMRIEEARELTKGVEIRDDEPIPDDGASQARLAALRSSSINPLRRRRRGGR